MSTQLKKKIAFVVSSPRVYLWKVDLINKLSETQDIYLFANLEEAEIDKNLFNTSIKIIHLPVIRKINLIGDVRALYLLIYHLFNLNLSVLHSITPKAGLLSMIAGFICRIPNRIHTALHVSTGTSGLKINSKFVI